MNANATRVPATAAHTNFPNALVPLPPGKAGTR